jgi:prepilin-type processing-associated H-X9-DG protein
MAVLTGSAALITVYMFFAVQRADSTSNRVRCASNLRQIGQAILLYSNENRGAYPRATYDPEKADQPTAFTHPDAQPDDDEKTQGYKPPFVKSGPGPNDVTAAFFLLLINEEIRADVFLCPTAAGTTTQVDPPNDETQCNFSDPRQLSYSYCNPYPSDIAVSDGFNLTNNLPADFAVAADINPGVDELLTANTNSPVDEMRKVNSPNHSGDGQNVLYADGHVEFDNNPFCGMQRDNIYTYGRSGAASGGDGIIGSPSSAQDSVLLPTAKQTAPAPPAK